MRMLEKSAEEMNADESKLMHDLRNMEKEHYGNKIRKSMYALKELHNAIVENGDNLKMELAEEFLKREKAKSALEVEEIDFRIESLKEKIKHFDQLASQTKRTKQYSPQQVTAMLKKLS